MPGRYLDSLITAFSRLHFPWRRIGSFLSEKAQPTDEADDIICKTGHYYLGYLRSKKFKKQMVLKKRLENCPLLPGEINFLWLQLLGLLH